MAVRVVLKLAPFLTAGVSAVGEAKQSYGWSKYRYTRYEKYPNDQDVESAILAGGDVKCEVCEVILQDIVSELHEKKKLGGKADVEAILEALEAEYIDEDAVTSAREVGNEMEEYMEKYKKGCNRFFKERWLQKGWRVESCPKPHIHGPEVMVPWACARFKGPGAVPEKKELDSYTVENEAIWYGCDVTLARHRDEVAEYMAENYHAHKVTSGGKFKKLAGDACEKIAQCKKRRPIEEYNARADIIRKKRDSYDDDIDKMIEKAKKTILKDQKKEDRKKKKGEKMEKMEDGKVYVSEDEDDDPDKVEL